MSKVGIQYKPVSELVATAAGLAADVLGIEKAAGDVEKMTLTQLATFMNLPASDLDVTSAGLAADLLSIEKANGDVETLNLSQLATFMEANLGDVTPDSLVVTSSIDSSSALLSFFGATKTSQPAAMTTPVTSAIDGTYGSAENEVLSSVRVRLGELSNLLGDLGITA